MLSPNATWHGNSPAAPAALEALCRIAEVELPEDYLSFLAFSNGGEGPLGIEPGYIVVDSAEDAASQQEEKIFAEFFPGFFKFGGNGAGEMFAFDLRGSKPWPVVMIDMTNCDLKESVIQIADNFQQLLRNIGFELKFPP
ncbi:MAG: SMI1/KNR4 family protein [Verrucomicrobiaceae bacterium]|nr:SMI1/KNR4 family protein [Verrucomicrobiaceae bacterium]